MQDAVLHSTDTVRLDHNGFRPDPSDFGISLEKYSPLVRKAVVRLMKDFRNNITIEMVAEELKVHPCHLEREAKKYCKTLTLKQLLIGLRLHCAVFLMTDEELRLNEIAELSGFSSARDFYRCFRSHLGMTAKEFRRQYSFEDFKLIYSSRWKIHSIENFVQGNATNARKWH
jgi:AraC-like DNA-binding protein